MAPNLPGYLSVNTTSDPLAANVVALLNFNGTNGSTTFTDLTGKTWIANGNAQLSTTNPRYGTASGQFDGSGDYITTATNTPFALPGDFCAEMWVFPTANASGSCPLFTTTQDSPTPNNGFLLYLISGGTTVQVFDYGAFSVVFPSPPSLPLNTWTHVACVRSGSTMTLYINGVSATSATRTTSFAAPVVGIGGFPTGGTNSFNGRLDDFRLTTAVPRYTGNFTPPGELVLSVPNDFNIPAVIQEGDFFAVSAAVGAARIFPGAGRRIGTAAIGAAVSLTQGQSLRIVARDATQLDLVA